MDKKPTTLTLPQEYEVLLKAILTTDEKVT